MRKLSEKAMSQQESRIPQLAESAVQQARANTLKAGRSVVEAVGGKLIETRPDGTSRVIKSIPAPTPVVAGQKRVRKAK